MWILSKGHPPVQSMSAGSNPQVQQWYCHPGLSYTLTTGALLHLWNAAIQICAKIEWDAAQNARLNLSATDFTDLLFSTLSVTSVFVPNQ